jgi:hypothetical protein
LGEIGRIKINKKLYKKEFWTTITTLQPEDLLSVLNYLLKLRSG